MIKDQVQIFGLAIALGGFMLTVGCGRAKQTTLADPLMDVFRRQAQEEGLSRQQTQGKRLFVHYCVTCHGDKGEGDGQNAYNLNPAPPNFKESLKATPSSYWKQIIEGGTAAIGRSPLCPPWGRELSGRQIDAIVSYMRTLSQPTEGSKPADSSATQAK
jgi:mono/diheme cytochrome c family protein